MGVHELVLDLKRVRSSGIRKTRLEKVPALREALGVLHPDLPESQLRFELEALLDQAAGRLHEPHERGVQLALDIHGAVVPLLTDHTKKVPNSRDRRLAFAAHYGVSEFNARDKSSGGPSLEEQVFALLAGTIIDLVGTGSESGPDVSPIQEATLSPPAPLAQMPSVANDAVETLRQYADAAEAMGFWDVAASWTFALVGLVGRQAGESGGNHESVLRDDYLRASQTSMMAGKLDEADDHLRNAQQIGQTLHDLDPANDSHQLALATALVSRAGLHWVRSPGSLGAEDELSRAVQLLRELVERSPDEVLGREMLALGLLQYGTQIWLADDGRALDVLTESLDHYERLLTDTPGDLVRRALESSVLTILGSLHVFADQVQEGEEMLLRARDTLESLVEATSSDPWVRALLEQLPIMLAQVLYSLAVAYGSADRLADAGVALRRAESFIESATALEPGRTAPVVAPGVGRLTAQVLFMLGLTHLEEGDEGAAQEYLDRSRDLDRQLLAGNPGDADVLELVLAHLEMLDEIWQETGQFAEAEQARAEARELRRLHANQERRETGW